MLNCDYIDCYVIEEIDNIENIKVVKWMNDIIHEANIRNLTYENLLVKVFK